MSKSRILFTLHLPPPVHGAAMVGKFIHDSKLINSEFDCHYINLTTASSLEDLGQVGWHKVKTFWGVFQKIRRSVKDLKPDLVYVTPNAKGGAFYKDFVVVMMLKRMGCKVVLHYHNKGVATRQDRWLDNLLYRRFFKDAKVILLAEALYADIQKYVKRGNVFVCPNGIPASREFESKRGENAVNKVPHILFLSNLLVDKGVMVLLDALKILKEKGYSFVCNFVGGETAEIDAKQFEEEVEGRGINGYVVYKGKKYGLDKVIEFESADLFVLPSFNEAFPLVNLEAMSYGIPVVSTNVGGVTEAIKDGVNGFICEKRDVRSLALQIEKLIVDKELRERMGRRGQQMFKERFTLETFEKRLCEILNQL